MLGVNHALGVNLEIKGVVGVFGVVRVAAQGLGPADDLAYVFNQRFALGDVLHCKHPFAVHARKACLDAATVCAWGSGFFGGRGLFRDGGGGHWKNLVC